LDSILVIGVMNAKL